MSEIDDNNERYGSQNSDVESSSNQPETGQRRKHRKKHKKNKVKKVQQTQPQANQRSFSNLEVILGVSVCFILIGSIILLLLRISMFDYCAIEYIEVKQISILDELYQAPELNKLKNPSNKTSRRKRELTESHSFGFETYAGRPLIDEEYKFICGLCFFTFCPNLESIAVMATPQWVIACDSSVKEIEQRFGADKNKIEILEWGFNDWILYSINKTIHHPNEDIRLIKSNTIFRNPSSNCISLLSPIDYNSLTNRDMLVLVTVERNQNWTANRFKGWAQPLFLDEDQIFVVDKLPFTDNNLQIVTYGSMMYGLMSVNPSSLVTLSPKADWVNAIIHKE